MDSTSIDLHGSEIQEITCQNSTLRIHFSRAYIIKTMTGSAERTRWWQAGDLLFDNAELQTELPQGPLICDGGDIAENLYTYRDMIPIPLQSRGYARCILKFRDQPHALRAEARGVRLQLIDVAKYIEHIRPSYNSPNPNTN